MRHWIALCLVAALATACGDPDLGIDEDGGGKNVGGGAPGGGNAGGGGTVGEDDDPPDRGVGGSGGSLEGSFACELSATTAELPAEQNLALAAGQYVESLLMATKEGPRASIGSVAALEPFLENLPEVAGAPPALTLSAPDEKGRYVLSSRARAEDLGVAETPASLHVIAVVDVSPSNETSATIRDRVLSELATGVDLDGDAKFSVVAFSANATTVLDRVKSGEAVAELGEQSVRDGIAPSEGENLLDALKLASALRAEGDVTHLVVLTDGGFLASDTVRALVADLAGEPSPTRVSIAQLASFAGATPDSAPELRAALLAGVSRPGRGLALFIDDARPIEFETWFNRQIAADGLVELDLPAGLVLDPAEVGEGGGGGTINGSMAISLEVGVTDECDLGGQPSPGTVRISVGELALALPLASADGALSFFSAGETAAAREAAEARLQAVLDGGPCTPAATVGQACLLTPAIDHDCAVARAITAMLDQACDLGTP